MLEERSRRSWIRALGSRLLLVSDVVIGQSDMRVMESAAEAKATLLLEMSMTTPPRLLTMLLQYTGSGSGSGECRSDG